MIEHYNTFDLIKWDMKFFFVYELDNMFSLRNIKNALFIIEHLLWFKY